MSGYKQILLAADLNTDESHPLIRRAEEFALTGSSLNIVHVVEQPYTYGMPFEIPSIAEWQQELEAAALKKLRRLGTHLHVPQERQFLQIGSPKTVILEVAKQISADLIIVGSHGKHGINLLLLGSTANGVLHGATCDVLAVRVHEKGGK